MPKRIQLRRTKGWRKPEGAVVVARPTRWGNPFTVVNAHRQGWLVYDDRPRFGSAGSCDCGYLRAFPTRREAAAFAVKCYRKWLRSSAFRGVDLVPLLRGRDLCCWCPPDLPCHADVLLEIANGSSS